MIDGKYCGVCSEAKYISIADLSTFIWFPLRFEAWLHLFLSTGLLNKGVNISVMITNSPVRLYVDSSRDSFPFYPHQFKSLACEDSTGQIKVLDSALFWSGLWSLKHITWQASSITVSYLAVLSTGGVKTWWNRPQIQVLETSGRSFSERKTEPAIYRTPQTHRQKGEIPNGRTRIPRWDVRWSALYEIVVMEPERGAARLLRPTTQIKPSSRPPNCRHGDSKPDRYHHDPSMSYINTSIWLDSATL